MPGYVSSVFLKLWPVTWQWGNFRRPSEVRKLSIHLAWADTNDCVLKNSVDGSCFVEFVFPVCCGIVENFYFFWRSLMFESILSFCNKIKKIYSDFWNCWKLVYKEYLIHWKLRNKLYQFWKYRFNEMSTQCVNTILVIWKKNHNYSSLFNDKRFLWKSIIKYAQSTF